MFRSWPIFGLLPLVLIVVLLFISWRTIVYFWKHSNTTEEDDNPREMTAIDYFKIIIIVIAVLAIFPRAPEIIAPLIE